MPAVFTPPVELYVPPVPAGEDGRNKPGWRLMQFFPVGPRGVNVFKMADGTYLRDDRQGVWPTTPDVPNDAISWTWGVGALSPIVSPIDNPVLFVYYGGHSYDVTDEEAARLTGAGYGENLT
jgi:hypothetical protein